MTLIQSTDGWWYWETPEGSQLSPSFMTKVKAMRWKEEIFAVVLAEVIK